MSNPSIDDQIGFYDQWNLNCRAVPFEDVDSKVRARAEVILNWISNSGLQHPNILEVGCGTGWFTEKLAQHGDVVAIDLSPEAIRFASSRNIDAEFLAENLMDRGFSPDRRYDLAVSIDTIFHVEDARLFVKRVCELLKPDGIFYLACINKFVYERLSSVDSVSKGQIRSWLSIKELSVLLAEYFHVETVQTIRPEGDMGILRLVNSTRVNRFFNGLSSKESVDGLKEKMRLGGGVVMAARKVQVTNDRA